MKRREAEVGGRAGERAASKTSKLSARVSGSDSVTLTAGKEGRGHSAVPPRSVTSRVASNPLLVSVCCLWIYGGGEGYGEEWCLLSLLFV